jgi:hypothetical protein
VGYCFADHGLPPVPMINVCATNKPVVIFLVIIEDIFHSR